MDQYKFIYILKLIEAFPYSSQGTLEFTQELYKDLYSWEDKKQLSRDTFLANRDKYMEVVRTTVSRDLNIEQK